MVIEKLLMICGKESRELWRKMQINCPRSLWLLFTAGVRIKLSAFTPAFIKRLKKTHLLYICFRTFIMSLCFLGHRFCNEPSPIENGYIIATEFWEGKNITYKCNKGYWLRGPPVRVCDAATGNWTMEAPICEGRLYSWKSWITLLVDSNAIVLRSCSVKWKTIKEVKALSCLFFKSNNKKKQLFIARQWGRYFFSQHVLKGKITIARERTGQVVLSYAWKARWFLQHLVADVFAKSKKTSKYFKRFGLIFVFSGDFIGEKTLSLLPTQPFSVTSNCAIF